MNPLNPKGQRVFGVSRVVFLVLPWAKGCKWDLLRLVWASSFVSLFAFSHEPLSSVILAESDKFLNLSAQKVLFLLCIPQRGIFWCSFQGGK